MAPEALPSPRLTDRLRARLHGWAGTPGSGRRVIVRNGAWETASFGVHAAVMFFLSPFIVHRLGTSLYGVWEMIVALTGFLGFADLGVRPAIVHYIARYDARGDDDALSRFVNSSFVTFSVAGVVVILVAVPLAFLLPRFWHIAPGFEAEASLALLIIAVSVGVELPLNAFSAILVGKQRYDRLGQLRLLFLGLSAAGIVFVLSRGWGLVPLALVIAVTRVGRLLANAVAGYRLLPGLKFDPRTATWSAVRDLLKFGGWAMFVLVGLQFIWATDALVIGRAISDTAVAYFAIGFKLAFYARELLRVSARVLEPAAGALHGLGDADGIRRLMTRSGRVMVLLSGPVIVYLLVVGKPFLVTWMDAEIAKASAGVLAIMTLAVVPAIASAPLGAAFYGTNRVRPLGILVAIEAALNLGLSILFVGPWGIEGVAWGTAIPAFLVHVVLIPAYLCRQYGMSFPKFLLTTWAGPVLAGVLAFFALKAIVNPEAVYGWPMLIALSAVSVVLFGAAALLLHRLFPVLFDQESLLARRSGTAS